MSNQSIVENVAVNTCGGLNVITKGMHTLLESCIVLLTFFFFGSVSRLLKLIRFT